MSFLLDSNILIHSARPEMQLQRWIQDPEAAVSAISQVEVLGFADLRPTA